MTAPLRPAWGLLLLLSACDGSKAAEECVQNGDCEEGQACIDGSCATVDCLSSAGCDIQQYCGDDFTCKDGCDADEDCFAGERCDTSTNTCRDYGCRDTQLDCDYGQICDVVSGQCYDWAEDHPGADLCGSCDPSVTTGRCGNDGLCFLAEEQGACSSTTFSCPSGQACGIAEYDDSSSCFDTVFHSDCRSGEYCLDSYGAQGPFCSRVACFTGQCYEGCDPDDPNACPRGFQCVDASGDRDYVCFADCTYLQDGGWL
jgi:hypothetical protein